MSNPSLIPNSHATRRKVIIILSNLDSNWLDIHDDNKLRANPNVCLVNYQSIGSDYGILERIKPIIAPNMVLIQSPYDCDVYEVSSDAIYKYSIAKHVIATQLFRMLGCRELEVMQLDIQGEKETRQYKLAGNHPEAKIDIQSLSVSEKSLLSEVRLKEVYHGSKPRTEQAHEYLKKHYLTNDSNLMGLIDKRGDEENRLKEYSLQVSLTQETKHAVEILGSIGIPKFLVNISASVSKITESTSQYKVTYRAVF